LQQDTSGAWISADGRWRWNGQAWISTGVSASVPVPLSFGDVISLPTRDPRWFGKCGIEGLIALIPIYGSFEIIGWSLTFLDNLRAGRPELPEARFGYASRGAGVASVALIYGLIGIVLFYLVFGGLAFLLISLAPPSTGATSSNSGGPFPAVFFAGMFGFQSVFFLLYALLYFLVVPIILRTERHGVGAGLNLWAAIKMAREDLRTAAVSAILLFLAAFFAGLGIYACLVGVVFSYGFAAAMLGATIRWYEERRPAN
jgi:predicted secreted protein